MKAELWKNVKTGQYLIYADETDGVHKVRVTEINIKVETFEPAYKAEYPYGQTADQGYVKIYWKMNDIEHEIVENLANLITFNNSWYDQLSMAYDDYVQRVGYADEYLETFHSKAIELREK